MNPIAETAGRLLDNGQSFVLATIVSRQGSTPRTAGTRMIVASNGHAVGTIGGGALEYQVIQTAAEVLATQKSRLLSFEMTPHDRVQPLPTGEVKPAGITLAYQGMPGAVPGVFYDQIKYQR